jgi:RNA polymerase subunit RPABC4/transcription elongation factor Spt4
MSILVYTKVTCDRAGCNSSIIQDGGNQSLPAGWSKVSGFDDKGTITFDMITCPRCLMVINPAPKKTRADKGVPNKKRGVRKAQDGQGDPETPPPAETPTRHPKCPVCGATTHSEDWHSQQVMKDVVDQAETPESAAKTRVIQHIPCAGCPDKDRKKCVKVAVEALDCWNAKPRSAAEEESRE